MLQPKKPTALMLNLGNVFSNSKYQLVNVFPVLCLLAALFSLMGCASKPKKIEAPAAAFFIKETTDFSSDYVSRKLLMGAWVSESDDADGTHRHEDVVRYSDGKYRVHFQSTVAGSIVTDQTEVGLWGVSGNVYFTITQGIIVDGHMSRVDAEDATFYDAYNIKRLSPTMFEHVHASGGQRFIEHKVQSTSAQ